VFVERLALPTPNVNRPSSSTLLVHPVRATTPMIWTTRCFRFGSVFEREYQDMKVGYVLSSEEYAPHSRRHLFGERFM